MILFIPLYGSIIFHFLQIGLYSKPVVQTDRVQKNSTGQNLGEINIAEPKRPHHIEEATYSNEEEAKYNSAKDREVKQGALETIGGFEKRSKSTSCELKEPMKIMENLSFTVSLTYISFTYCRMGKFS